MLLNRPIDVVGDRHDRRVLGASFRHFRNGLVSVGRKNGNRRTPRLGLGVAKQTASSSGACLGQIHPKSCTQVVAPDEQGKRLLSKTTSIGVTGGRTMTGPVHLVVDVIVGADGHVWKAVAKSAPSKLVASAAWAAIKSWIYRA